MSSWLSGVIDYLKLSNLHLVNSNRKGFFERANGVRYETTSMSEGGGDFIQDSLSPRIVLLGW
jgi:hypothetical protein